MDQQEIITALEDRARAAHISIAEVCRRADIHPTTFSRWKVSDKNPDPVGANLKNLVAIDEVLTEAERELTHKRKRA